MILSALSRAWPMVMVRGVAAIAFGVAALAWPGLTLGFLVTLFGVFAIVDGALTVVSAVRGTGGQDWSLLLWGIIGIVAGIAIIAWPGLTAIFFVTLIGVWAIATGIAQIVAAIRIRREIEGEWMLVLSGALSILVGVVLAVAPGEGALSLTWLIGGFAIVFGILTVILAWRLRGMGERIDAGTQEPAF